MQIKNKFEAPETDDEPEDCEVCGADDGEFLQDFEQKAKKKVIFEKMPKKNSQSSKKRFQDLEINVVQGESVNAKSPSTAARRIRSALRSGRSRFRRSHVNLARPSPLLTPVVWALIIMATRRLL